MNLVCILKCEPDYVNNLPGKTAIYTKGELKLPLVNLFIELEHKKYNSSEDTWY